MLIICKNCGEKRKLYAKGFCATCYREAYSTGKIALHSPKIKGKIKEIVFDRDNHQCKICQQSNELTIQPIQPLDRGGEVKPDNLISVCQYCVENKLSEWLLRHFHNWPAYSYPVIPLSGGKWGVWRIVTG